ncbi:PhoH-like protein [Nymphon striatum]|nr:PhoH-like protein [Nymphon striatum]
MEITLKPEDNTRLANLCGPLDENIKQIETALEVNVNRRGATFSITGKQDNMRMAAQIIENFYIRAKNPIELEDVQLGLVEVEKLSPDAVESSTSMPVLMTKRGDLHGRTPRQVEYLKQIQDHDITFGIGPAGTGKTYLAVASAVDAMTRDRVKRIVLVRPAVEAGERLGFLPGDLNQKVDPYLRPLYDALYDLAGYDTVNKMFERNAIEVAPLAYMRGRTLNQSFIILDEAQNTTPEQMKMFLTRIGFGTKAVITGDVTQIDLQRGQKSGLVESQKILKNIKGIAMTKFLSQDVVRHPLVQKIVNAYENLMESIEIATLAQLGYDNPLHHQNLTLFTTLINHSQPYVINGNYQKEDPFLFNGVSLMLIQKVFLIFPVFTPKVWLKLKVDEFLSFSPDLIMWFVISSVVILTSYLTARIVRLTLKKNSKLVVGW